MRTLRFFELAVGLLCVQCARAEPGLCRFDETACKSAYFPLVSNIYIVTRFTNKWVVRISGSCKYGEEEQGICWSFSGNVSHPEICTSRYCKRGWTCSCFGRTHVCRISNRTVLKPLSMETGSNSTGATQIRTENNCKETSVLVAKSAEIELGGWIGKFSVAGLLSGYCTEFSWWLNGEEMLALPKGSVSEKSLNAELQARSVHLLIDIRPGDLVAFRFRGGSYFCQNSFYIFNVNGTTQTISNLQNQEKIRFAREYSTGWNQPWYVPQLGTSEHTAEAWHFVPLRTKFFFNNSVIEPGVDYYRPDDGSRDHELTNFYFRVQL